MTEPYLIGRGDATKIPLPDQSVDLVMGSPPYCDARTYDDGTLPAGHVVSRDAAEWVEWMLAVTTEALRVSRGAVVWVAAGVTRDYNYWPAVEGLAWEWFKRGGHAYRPCYWFRQGIPGSGGRQWFRADVEYCLAFKRPGKLPWADNKAMGHPPKYAPGGGMSNRKADGSRVNPWGGGGTSAGRRADGTKRTAKLGFRVEAAITAAKGYEAPAICNPGTLIKTLNGGGHMGSKLAHLNEAPFVEDLPLFFIKSLTRHGDKVLDVFSGSGTTAAAAVKAGRVGLGFDLRQSQCLLGRRRMAEAMSPKPAPKRKAKDRANYVMQQLDNFDAAE